MQRVLLFIFILSKLLLSYESAPDPWDKEGGHNCTVKFYTLCHRDIPTSVQNFRKIKKIKLQGFVT